MRKNINLYLLLVFTLSLTAEDLKWHSFEEAYDIAKRDNKIILIDFYTDWCGWCKKMDKDTYSDEKIIDMLNKDFVVVKINPEKTGYIETEKGNIRYSQLARDLGVRAYPSTGFFTKDFQLIEVISGYFDPENMEVLLRFMGDNLFEKLSFQDYKLFAEAKSMSEEDESSPKLNFILGYFYMNFFNDIEKAHKNFQIALNNNLENKEVYAALSLTSTDSKNWMEKARELGYKEKSELDNLVVSYVREIFSRKRKN